MRSGLWAGALALLLGVLGVTGCRPEDPNRVPGTLATTPADLEFGPVALGQFREEQVTLQNTSRFPIQVARISSTLASVTVLDGEGFTLAPGAEHPVRVRFAPAVEGDVSGQLVLETDLLDAQEGVHRMEMRGTGVRSYVDIFPKTLDFGAVEVDTVKVLSVEAHNPTGVEAVFTLTFSGDDADGFSSSEGGREVRVGPGETRQVPIAFRPLRLGLAQATATFTRCPSCGPEVVSLSGEGVAAMLEIFPTRLDFGRVGLGARAEQRLTLRNNGNQAATFHRAWVDQGEGVFTLVNLPPQLTLGQGQSVEVTVAFQPPATSTYVGALRLDVEAGNVPRRTVTVRLTGEGGATCVTFLPRTLDFGTVPEGMSLTREVYAFNRCQEDVTLSDLTVRASQGGYFSLATSASSLVVPKGGKVPVHVAFTPRAGSSSSEGTLTASVRQGSAIGSETVGLKGASRTFAPCQYRVDPQQLSFGRVQVGSTVTLGVGLTNVGTEECFVSRMGLAGGTDPTFSVEPFTGGTLAPGERRVLLVHFKPVREGGASGLVEGVVNHPTQGLFTVPLSAEGVDSCFTLEPGTVDFGTLKLACGARQRQVVAINRCTSPVTLTGATLDAATSGDLALAGAPGFPHALNPGAQVAFTLSYQPQDEGEDTAAFRVSSAQEGTMTVGLLGRGLSKPTHTDRFIQETQNKVDVLFVIDNSGSMMEEQQNLGENFAAFMSAAQGTGVDYHIGVTTTGIEGSSGGWSVCPGGVDGGEAGRLFPVNGSSPRVITPTTPNASAVFANNVKVGWCHWNEMGLEAAYRALSSPLVNSVDDPRTPLAQDGNAGFLRSEARLALVFVTDEEDFSPQSVAFYETFFKGLKGNDPDKLSISAIIGPENLTSCPTASSTGSRYLALARATGGAVESICTADWAKSLKNLSTNIYGPKTSFPLSQQPSDPAQISVQVNGVPVTGGWRYDAAKNAVVFDSASVPPPGALVEITYPLGC